MAMNKIRLQFSDRGPYGDSPNGGHSEAEMGQYIFIDAMAKVSPLSAKNHGLHAVIIKSPVKEEYLALPATQSSCGRKVDNSLHFLKAILLSVTLWRMT